MDQEISIHNHTARIDIDFIFHYLHDISYWAKGRSRKIIEKSIENSLCFIVEKMGQQIGFARVLTDFATFAYIADVFVVEKEQGNGYGKKLVDAILNHADLREIKRWMLLTEDAHELYKKYGFRAPEKPEIIMEKVRPN